MNRHWMFRCNDVSMKISESMDRRLPLPDRVMVKLHLLMCGYCRRFVHQLRFLRDLCRLPVEDVAEEAETPSGSGESLPEPVKARLISHLKSNLPNG